METGFIGLGAMGRAMAANLIKAGHRVRVWNRSPGAAQKLARLGAEPVDDPRKAFGEIIFSMLADDDAMREVFLAPGLLDAAPAGAVHVNMATISVRLASVLVQEHRTRGLGYVAAPVFKNYGALIANRKYDPAGFRLVLGLKDVRLALEAADQARSPMPFASVLHNHLLEAVVQGDGDRDWAALAEVARRHAGL